MSKQQPMCDQEPWNNIRHRCCCVFHNGDDPPISECDYHRTLRTDNDRLRAECLRLSQAEAEAMAVVLSQEGQIERLRAEAEMADVNLAAENHELRKRLDATIQQREQWREQCVRLLELDGDFECQSAVAGPSDTARYYCQKTGLPVGVGNQPHAAPCPKCGNNGDHGGCPQCGRRLIGAGG